ncbi:MAG: hypothetical protein KGI75_12775 [Rhizobiaceae bacterium]|nr:hypothetical protein [Rhizobiaceae bacterium]
MSTNSSRNLDDGQENEQALAKIQHSRVREDKQEKAPRKAAIVADPNNRLDDGHEGHDSE